MPSSARPEPEPFDHRMGVARHSGNLGRRSGCRDMGQEVIQSCPGCGSLGHPRVRHPFMTHGHVGPTRWETSNQPPGSGSADSRFLCRSSGSIRQTFATRRPVVHAVKRADAGRPWAWRPCDAPSSSQPHLGRFLSALVDLVALHACWYQVSEFSRPERSPGRVNAAGLAPCRAAESGTCERPDSHPSAC